MKHFQFFTSLIISKDIFVCEIPHLMVLNPLLKEGIESEANSLICAPPGNPASWGRAQATGSTQRSALLSWPAQYEGWVKSIWHGNETQNLVRRDPSPSLSIQTNLEPSTTPQKIVCELQMETLVLPEPLTSFPKEWSSMLSSDFPSHIFFEPTKHLVMWAWK